MPHLVFKHREEDRNSKLVKDFLTLKNMIIAPFIQLSKYTYDDFEILEHLIKSDEGGNIGIVFQIDCPDWDFPPLAKRIFICYDKNFSNPRYFTIEYDDNREVPFFTLCESLYVKNDNETNKSSLLVNKHVYIDEIEDDDYLQLEVIKEIYENETGL